MKKPTSKKPKKRNPPDATHRNIRALKKRVAELEIIALRHRAELNDLKAMVERVDFERIKQQYRIKDYGPK